MPEMTRNFISFSCPEHTMSAEDENGGQITHHRRIAVQDSSCSSGQKPITAFLMSGHDFGSESVECKGNLGVFEAFGRNMPGGYVPLSRGIVACVNPLMVNNIEALPNGIQN